MSNQLKTNSKHFIFSKLSRVSIYVYTSAKKNNALTWFFFRRYITILKLNDCKTSVVKYNSIPFLSFQLWKLRLVISILVFLCPPPSTLARSRDIHLKKYVQQPYFQNMHKSLMQIKSVLKVFLSNW